MTIDLEPFEDSGLESLLLRVATTGSASPTDRAHLETSVLRAAWQLDAFQITAETVADLVEQRIRRLQTVYPILNQFSQENFGWQNCPIALLWQLWLPLVEQIAAWHALNHPLVLGILGGQGTGKTTLTLILAEILSQIDVQVCRLSIDDLYKTYAERQQLQQFDPRFRWRGPPGTHDVELGLTVLNQLRQAEFPVAVPRFDKSAHNGAGDRTQPEWVDGADVILFEGWFVGVQPINPQAFEQAPAPINTDADRAFARDINTYLQAYLPLWEQLDRLIVLYPSDYRFSQQWRQQAEQRMITTGQSGMSASEINEFVTYFWRSLHPDLFIQPLLQDPEQVDWAIEIDANHYPRSIYRPQRQ